MSSRSISLRHPEKFYSRGQFLTPTMTNQFSVMEGSTEQVVARLAPSGSTPRWLSPSPSLNSVAL